jgi:hypothetical protein
MLWALQSFPTMGEATARFNGLRYTAGAPLAYVLLGDPELPAGAARWVRWATSVEPQGPSSLDTDVVSIIIPNTNTPFCEMQLGIGHPRVDQCATTFVSSHEGSELPVLGRVFDTWDRSVLWLSPVLPAGAGIQVERRQLVSLMPDLKCAAGSVRARSLCWSSLMEPAKPALLDAAESFLKLQSELSLLENALVSGRIAELQKTISGVVEQWQAAHYLGLATVVRDVAPDGLWPLRMWTASRFENRLTDRRCPYCDMRPTLVRSYHTPPCGTREMWSCFQCDLIADLPAGSPLIVVAFDGPNSVSVGGTDTVRLSIGCAEGAPPLMGSVAILIDGRGHGAAFDPSAFQICLPAGQTALCEARFGVPPTAIPQRYRLRALLLLNACWYILTRPIKFRPKDPPK